MNNQVLVVDDESVTRRVVTHALKTVNIEVLDAGSGAEALVIAREHAVALAIVDINLPDMDGFEVIRQLRLLPHLRQIPIIVFTARNHPGDRHTAMEVGASDFLYKPFSTQELRDLMTRHLSQS